jgi:acyloxyacyl hydrolase
MTTPQEFYKNVVSALNYLDTVLPMGSHVVFMGLVDGRVLYDSMAHRIHPIGAWRKDVTYSQFYDYMNCLQISPCFGWMNSDSYWRNVTTQRAFELNHVYSQVT